MATVVLSNLPLDEGDNISVLSAESYILELPSRWAQQRESKVDNGLPATPQRQKSFRRDTEEFQTQMMNLNSVASCNPPKPACRKTTMRHATMVQTRPLMNGISG
jgi:hypothetical protein